ncbi:uncharacterized protein LOC9645625 [Selaginella moellendorffii]|uniref:uncharacterized protein LOC9645625 n=1 Tax=Selaginella moellendorffii TaxID=88036 RepID=UPI000D1CA050|nr:uncharacterized protein LOC9645625 [Selaginella moellendorffii]|eukprot:XP_024536544.1 uncharacterized protein LOC9645625 [Selaginella moellendorffii]
MEALALAFSWLRRAPAQASTQATGLKVLLLETPAATADKKAEDFPALSSQLEAVIASSEPASTVPEYDAPVLEEDDEHDLQEVTPDVANLLLQPVAPIELEDSSSPAPPSHLEAVIAGAASSVPEYDPPPLPVLEDDNHDLQELEAVMVGAVDSVRYTSLGGKTLAIDDDDDNLSWEDIQSYFRTWTFPSVQLPSRAEMHLEVEELKKLVGEWTWKLPTTLQSIKEEMWSRLLNAGLEEDEVTSQELWEELKNFLGWHRFPVISSRRMLLEAAPGPPIFVSNENGPSLFRFIAPLRTQQDGEEQASVFWQRLRGDGTSSVRKHRRPPDKNSEGQELVAAMAEESSYKVLKSHAAAGSRKLLRQADVSSPPASVFWRSLRGDGVGMHRRLPYKNIEELAAAMADESSYKVLKSHAAKGFPSQKLLAGGTGDTKEASSNASPPPASPPPFMWRWFPRSLGEDGGKAKRINTETFQEAEGTSISSSQSLVYDIGVSSGSGSASDFIELFEGEGISSSDAFLNSLLEVEGGGSSGNVDLQQASSSDLNLQATAVAATPLLLPILAGLLVALLFLFFLYFLSNFGGRFLSAGETVALTSSRQEKNSFRGLLCLTLDRAAAMNIASIKPPHKVFATVLQPRAFQKLCDQHKF